MRRSNLVRLGMLRLHARARASQLGSAKRGAARQWQGAQKSLASACGGQPSAPKSPLAEKRNTPISGQKSSLTVKFLKIDALS